MIGWWLAACIENNLEGPKEETTSAPETTPSVTTPTRPLDLPGPGTVPLEGCSACPYSPAWDVVVEWQSELEGSSFYVPTVADLDDDDVPEVLFGASDIFQSEGHLAAWHSDGTLWREYSGPFHQVGGRPNVGDVDMDGDPDVVTVMGDVLEAYLQAMEVDGTILWQSETFSLSSDAMLVVGACQPVIVDLEGDGTTEVFCDVILVEGATGETRHRFPFDPAAALVTSTVSDLDRDGVAEIISGNKVWRADGTLWWEGPVPPSDWPASAPAALELDGDPQGEVLFVWGGSVSAHDTDGTLLWSTAVVSEVSGLSGLRAAAAPCVADFDGDGALEIVVPFSIEMALLELDGTLVWTYPIQDFTGMSSCFGFDFDMDGRAEIAYADEETFGLHCGVDGALLYADPSHASGTTTEFPVVVDLDLDGSAEVVVGRAVPPLDFDGPAQVVVYGQRDSLWPATGESWPQEDYHPDGAIASRPGEGEPLPHELGVNLGLVLVDQVGTCEGLSLSVQVHNAGPAEVPAGRLLEVWAVDEAILGELTKRLVRSIELPAVPSGAALAAIRIDLAPDELGQWGMYLELVPQDTPIECDPSDESVLLEFLCPR